MMNQPTLSTEVRALELSDAQAIHELDYSFETDRIYALHVLDRMITSETTNHLSSLSFELRETPVDRPLYKDYYAFADSLADVERILRGVDGGYTALAGGQVAGAILLNFEEWRSVASIEHIIVGRQFRRYGIGSLLLNCADDWARKRGCWAIVLETQNVNYPAIQFYLRNGLEVWSIHHHFYPPGPVEHEVAVFMGKKLR
jgi:GNAT superfamily N-acetyltransferase